MTELLLLLGKHLPEDHLIEEIKKYSTEYSITQSEYAKKHLQLNCMLFLAKQSTEGKSDAQVVNQMKEVGEMQRIRERLNTEKA